MTKPLSIEEDTLWANMVGVKGYKAVQLKKAEKHFIVIL